MDDVDFANNKQQTQLDDSILFIRRHAASMPIGEPGDCDLCGNESGRLVDGVCAPCRDKYKLK